MLKICVVLILFSSQVFEISCLSSDAQKALAALAQIVTQYTLQETTNAEQYEDVSLRVSFALGVYANVRDQYDCKVEKYRDSVVDIDLLDVDRPAQKQEPSTSVAGTLAEGIQEAWTCQFENSDVNKIATDEVLAEIGRLTGCILTRHSSAKGVRIKLGPAGDIQAARRKLFTLEWRHVSSQRSWKGFEVLLELTKAATRKTSHARSQNPEAKLVRAAL